VPFDRNKFIRELPNGTWRVDPSSEPRQLELDVAPDRKSAEYRANLSGSARTPRRFGNVNSVATAKSSPPTPAVG
jgi:hypothetical protein